MKSWKTETNEREKYSLYLASLEWAILKEAVKRRSGGICERCNVNKSDAVHHLTYNRKYHENLDDLQDICTPCHEFTHGKSDIDPAYRKKPNYLGGREIESFYLAGKISGNNDWRNSIVGCWSHDKFARTMEENWITLRDSWRGNDYEKMEFCGPWWVGENCGHHSSFYVAHNPHGKCEYILNRIITSINYADLVFAWIEGPDCYGTLWEIGFAVALCKTVVVAVREGADVGELWLSLDSAFHTSFGWKNPSEAWAEIWDSDESSMRQFLEDYS